MTGNDTLLDKLKKSNEGTDLIGRQPLPKFAICGYHFADG